MSKLRETEKRFTRQWNNYFPLIEENKNGDKVPSKVNVNHLLWMIYNKDSIGGDRKLVVRKLNTEVINPITGTRLHLSNMEKSLITHANDNGFNISNPTEDLRTPPRAQTPPKMMRTPAPPSSRTPLPRGPPPPPPRRPLPRRPLPGGPPVGPVFGGPAPAPGNGQQQIAQEAKLPALARSSGRNVPTQATPSQRFNQQPGFSLTPVVPTTAPAGFKSTPDDMGKKKLTDLSLKEIKEYNDFQRPLPEILERQNTICQTKTRQGSIQEASHPFGGKCDVTNESQINCNTNSKNPFIKSQARLKVKEIDDTSKIYRPQLQEAIDDAKPSAKLIAKMANMEALKVEVPVEPPFKARGFDPKELRPVFKINYTHGVVPQFVSERCKKKKAEVADVHTTYIKSKQMKDASDLFFQ
eukprot:jgi/Bigna1/134769/aug1.26_g9477